MNDSPATDVFPPAPRSLEELEDVLSTPAPAVVDALGRLDGDLMVLGVGGKMGPSLARMARRACDAAGRRCRVIGVSRFGAGDARQLLESSGVETIACDLLDEQAVAQLPEVPNIVFMAGFKFGASTAASMTWAVNCYLPALISRRFADSRIVAFSTGNVYSLMPREGPGSSEDDPPCPVGEYAMTALGRERMFQYFSEKLQIPLALLRLNYACELRYGVLVDLALKVWNDQPIDLSMGYFNVIWQADANAMALQALADPAIPPRIWNLAGPEILSVRDVCRQLGTLLNKTPHFIGEEAGDAFLSDGRRAHQQFGAPTMSAAQLTHWVADWVARGGENLGKPTHFETRDGTY